jgi:hypothetical protein
VAYEDAMKSVLDVQQHSPGLEGVAFQQLKHSPKLPRIFPNRRDEFR